MIIGMLLAVLLMGEAYAVEQERHRPFDIENRGLRYRRCL